MAAAEEGRRSPPNKEAVKGLPWERTARKCLGRTENRCEESEPGRTYRDKATDRLLCQAEPPVLYCKCEAWLARYVLPGELRRTPLYCVILGCARCSLLSRSLFKCVF